MSRRILTAQDQADYWKHGSSGIHPDLAHSIRLHGVAHTSCGRRLPGHHVANAFADPAGWRINDHFLPSDIAVQGAKAYNRLAGLPEIHDGSVNYLAARRDPDELKGAAQAYDSMPNYDPSATKYFDAMRNDVNNQYNFATRKMGIRPEYVDYDPYNGPDSMLADINNNKRLKVLKTEATGGHPYFSNADNDKFRFVHDLFGHAATGRSFDRHGEQAAYLAHSKMFSPQAQPALASETRGQNSSLIYNGSFQPQKVAALPRQHWGQTQSGLSIPMSGVQSGGH